jgi:hypothetical protein
MLKGNLPGFPTNKRRSFLQEQVEEGTTIQEDNWSSFRDRSNSQPYSPTDIMASDMSDTYAATMIDASKSRNEGI